MRLNSCTTISLLHYSSFAYRWPLMMIFSIYFGSRLIAFAVYKSISYLFIHYGPLQAIISLSFSHHILSARQCGKSSCSSFIACRLQKLELV